MEALEPPVEHEENKEQFPLVAPPPGEAVWLVMAGGGRRRRRQPRAAVASGQPHVSISTAHMQESICQFQRTKLLMRWFVNCDVRRSCMCAPHLITSKITLNVEKLSGSPAIDRLSVMQASITAAALQASGDSSMLFSDSLLLLFFSAPSLRSGSPAPLLVFSPPSSCTDNNVADAGMHLKIVGRHAKICQ